MTTVTHGSITATVNGTIVHIVPRRDPNGIRIHHSEIENIIACLQDLREGGSEREQLEREREGYTLAVARLDERNRAHLDLIGDLFHRLCQENEQCNVGHDGRMATGVRWAIRQIQSYCQTIGVDPRTLGKRSLVEIKAKEKREEANALRCRALVLETEAQELEQES